MMLSPVRGGISRSAEAQDDNLARRAQRADRAQQTAISSHVELAKPAPSTTTPSADSKDPNSMRENAARSRSEERHKRLVDDTAKLLQLSNELKSDVDKATKDELSVQVIQKAAEIEKLAHDVRERMKA
jgi:hypothetical protein